MMDWQDLGKDGTYKFPEHTGFYVVRLKDGEEVRSFYDGRFFKDANYDLICTLTITAWR